MMNSVFVPNVFGFNADEVKVLMEKYFGEVSDIDLILNSKGEWQAFVHFKCWYDREIVYKAIKIMDQGNAWKLRVPEKDTLVMLKNFSRTQQEVLPFVLERAVEAVQTFISSGIETAMNDHNRSD